MVGQEGSTAGGRDGGMRHDGGVEGSIAARWSPPVAGARTTRRRGRMTAAKKTVLASLGPRWTVGGNGWDGPELDRHFGRRASRLLDIGPGDGVAARAWAAEHPDWDVIAVEVHRPGLARLVSDLDASGPANVGVAEVDVTQLVDGLLGLGSVHAVRILFPDPWPKRRHHQRRLVDAAFLGRVADLLPPGGWVHVATDWADYADQVRAAVATEPRLQPSELAGGVADPVTGDVALAFAAEAWRSTRPERPPTPYERRGLAAGRCVTDLIARRT